MAPAKVPEHKYCKSWLWRPRSHGLPSYAPGSEPEAMTDAVESPGLNFVQPELFFQSEPQSSRGPPGASRGRSRPKLRARFTILSYPQSFARKDCYTTFRPVCPKEGYTTYCPSDRAGNRIAFFGTDRADSRITFFGTDRAESPL